MKKIINLFKSILSIPGIILRSITRVWPIELYGNNLRRWYYRKKFHSFGEKSIIQQGCTVFFPELMQIGHSSSVGRYTELNPGPGEKPCLVVGDNTWIGPYCFFRTSNHRFDDPDKLFIEQGSEEKKIILGDDVYVGAKCIFLGGADVGNHSVISAGSVVSIKIPPYSIVAGNPARVIRKRKEV
ncbi:MAG: acyltransferase [Candidatus Zapsychrus exili]|nr:acyltransferase [Candidatus Zapsychrus exili]